MCVTAKNPKMHTKKHARKTVPTLNNTYFRVDLMHCDFYEEHFLFEGPIYTYMKYLQSIFMVLEVRSVSIYLWVLISIFYVLLLFRDSGNLHFSRKVKLFCLSERQSQKKTKKLDIFCLVPLNYGNYEIKNVSNMFVQKMRQRTQIIILFCFIFVNFPIWLTVTRINSNNINTKHIFQMVYIFWS